MPESPRSDWRNTGSDASETPGLRPWKTKESETAGPKLPSRRFLRRAIVITCLFGLAIGLGVLASYLKGERPACLIVVGSGYEHNLLLPHNVYGWNGSLDVLKNVNAENPSWFAELIGQESGIRPTTAVNLVENNWPATWREINDRIKKGVPKEQVILYISAHGYADENDAYLLPNIANLKSPEEFNASRVRFSQILDSLKEDVPDKGILLLLDVCHVQSHWPIGMLRNDFVKRLQENKYTQQIKDIPNLTVICSTSPDQRSWAAEERKTTIFAEYVAKGLRGEGLPEGTRITAEGLFEYVEERVNEWAKTNRARDQIPTRIGGRSDPDPGLARVKRPTAKDDQDGKDEAPKEDPKKEEAAKANPGTNFNPDDLRSAWKSWMVLKKDFAPQVYSPHYWRLYQENLLRFEQLMRAGGPTQKTKKLEEELALLESDIKADMALDKAQDCLGNSFPLAHVLGFRPTGDFSGNEQKALIQLKANQIDRQKMTLAFQPFVAEKSEMERRYWHTRLSRLFLDEQLKKKESQRTNLARVLEIADELNLPDRPGAPRRAAEVQLVKMLQDPDLDKDVQPKLIKLAVEVRMLAEEAALGVPGEDGLSRLYAEAIFKRTHDHIVKADETRRKGEDLLFGDPKTRANAAEEHLTKAKDGYKKIGTTAATLRKAMGLRDDLAAELPFFATALALFPRVDSDTKRDIQAMLNKIESLGDNLALLIKALDTSDDPPPVQPIEDDLKYVRNQYHLMCTKLRDLGTDTLQQNWHALDSALSIPPPIDTEEGIELRIALLKKLRDTAKNLEDDRKYPAPQKDNAEGTIDVQRKLLSSLLKPYEEPKNVGPRSVDDKVRAFFLKQLSPDEIAETEKEATLLGAVKHSRVLLGCLADQMKNVKGERINPSKRLRYLRTHNLLVGLAQRTFEDHWYDPDAKNAPYYVPAAMAYLNSAAKILEPTDPVLRKGREDLKRKLLPTGLTVAGNPSRFWTTETSFDLKWTIDLEAGVPPGELTYWVEGPKGRLKDRETGPAPRLAPVSLNEKSPGMSGKVPITLHALYRGQHLTKSLDVDRPPPNVIVHNSPGLDKVGFAVRMDKTDYGAISIVLDNSGSMGYLHPKKAPNDKNVPADKSMGQTSRYDFALKAVRNVLGKSIPDGTPISIFNFGGEKDKDTIPVCLEPPKRWNKGRLDNVMAKLESADLNNDSPIADAIIESMKSGFPAGFKDPRLIIVLTDGMDNPSKNPLGKDGNTKRVIDELSRNARKYRDANIELDVVVVCFLEKEDKEYEYAEKQFQPFTKNGAFIQESKGGELGRIIENLVVRPHVQLKRKSKVVNGFEEGRPVDYQNDPLSWRPGLKFDDYTASVFNGNGKEFNVRMAAGHNIFAILKRGETKFVFERGIVGMQDEVKRNKGWPELKRDWLVTLLKNEKPVGENSRSQLVAFEKLKLGVDLQQVPPGFVWLEHEGIRPDQTLEWGRDLIVPAPTYLVDVASWSDGYPKLTASFWPRSWEDLLDTMKPKEIRINIKTLTSYPDSLIESVQWENRTVGVMTPAGRVVYMNKYCLVIRSRYLDGQQTYIGLKEKDDRKRIGSEHRFYDQAGKCTACFYDLPPTPEEIDFVMIPIARFKEAAVKEDTKVIFERTQPIEVPNIFRKAIIETLNDK